MKATGTHGIQTLQTVDLGGLGVVFRISGLDTRGSFSVVEHPVAPGRLVLPHTHEREDEYSYVLEGTIGARVGDREIVAGPGNWLLKPRGVMHTFWNGGATPVRLLEIIAPAGFETYFAELASSDEPSHREILAAKYGVTHSTEWVPDLTARYGLKLVGE